MIADLDIEQPDALLGYLRAAGRLTADEPATCTVLAGGVSNRTVLVERANGEAWVIKQALAKLRVAEDWFSDPARIQGEALGLIWLARLAPPGTITPLIFEDREQHLLGMQAVPQPHANWKTLLLAGKLTRDHVVQFGHLLGTIHRRSHEFAVEVAPIFENRTFFETLRLEPYYRFTATRHPATAAFFAKLIAETLSTRLSLVHGDYSPKNILVQAGRLVLLDHEVIHFGDPAFDLGFSLTHLLSKALHLPARRSNLLEAVGWYWESYSQSAGEIALLKNLEQRAARHTLACLLARVDGRSPLEYLTPAERARQREIVLSMIADPPTSVLDLTEEFGKKLNP
jgi:5-methylthioribose kinase